MNLKDVVNQALTDARPSFFLTVTVKARVRGESLRDSSLELVSVIARAIDAHWPGWPGETALRGADIECDAAEGEETA